MFFPLCFDRFIQVAQHKNEELDSFFFSKPNPRRIYPCEIRPIAHECVLSLCVLVGTYEPPCIFRPSVAGPWPISSIFLLGPGRVLVRNEIPLHDIVNPGVTCHAPKCHVWKSFLVDHWSSSDCGS